MSWKFPKHPLKNDRVPDADEMNENFLASGQELVGRLNEHNFKANTFTQTNVATRAAFVWHVGVGIDGPGGAGNQDRNYIPFTFGPSNYNAHDDTKTHFLVFAETQSWQEVSDSVLEFSSSSCIGQIHASAQIWVDGGIKLNTGDGFRGAGDIHPCQPQMAIKVDGVVIPETITGGVETAQDEILGVRPNQFCMPALTSIVLPLSPGPHRITIVVRAVGVPEGRAFRVGANELICLEMRV
tara:strand:- start:493 stop:1212 length:720 start_codon:yes stop_codon:yes gene_type:complete